jgi:signal transduction histidine kinase/ligand-binding sensor domain-containing protein
MSLMRHVLLHSGVWLAILLLATASTPAQYRFNEWTTDNGLPHNTVYDIHQTRDGYVWLTTFDGLVRFDGVRFTVFNRANSPGISSNRFLRLYEDASGDLWAGTEDSGLVRYHNGHFTSYGKEQGLTSIYETEDEHGRLVVLLTDGSARRLVDGKFVPVDSSNDVFLKPTNRRESHSILCHSTGSRVVCLGYGPGWTPADGMPSVDGPRGEAIQDTHGALWMVMEPGALVKIENAKVANVYTEGNGLPGRPLRFVIGAHTSCVSKDKHGTLWMTDLETTHSRFLGNDVPAAVEGNSISYEDREGNVWFATNQGGLFRARQRFINTYSTSEGLTQPNVYPIYQDTGGHIWVGANALFRYEDGNFTLDKTGPEDGITALAEDLQGRLIVGNIGTILVRDGDHFKRLLQKRSNVFRAIYPDRDGALWLGGEHGLVHLKDGSEKDYTTVDGLAGDDIKVIISDRAGGLWIGSYGGLTHYSDGRFTSWTERDGLPSRTVRALYKDDDGVLWIGTYDGGLGRFKDGKFTRYTTREGLFDNAAFQIPEDGRGNFWMSSNRGLYRVSRRELNDLAEGLRSTVTSVAYGKSDGLLNVECNGGHWPAGIKTSQGTLWFPTQDGVAVIDPAAVPVNPKPPPVHVESLLVDNAAVDFGNEVPIRPDQENFEIGYTALSYINSENIRFRYRLEGLDRDWVEAGTRRVAYYSHVPPGRYTFHVIAANSDGVWNTEGASVLIRVRPRFYQTWWFVSTVGLAFCAMVFGAYRIRVNRLEQARRAQEEFSQKLMASQEQERQRIAAELHDSLGQSLLIIKNRVALAQSDVKQTKMVEEQLEELSHSAGAAIDECREIAYNLRPYQISRFGLSKSLQGIFMRINDVTDIQATVEIESIDGLLSEDNQINIFRIVQECVNNIIKHSRATHASLSVKRGSGGIALNIGDDGCGFVQRQSASGNDFRGGGFGLIGITERVRLLGGTLEIKSSVGTGTRISINIPRELVRT